MKNTVKALIAQVKKAINNKSSIPVGVMAYADENGALIARSMKNNADITIFIAGIVEDVTKREKLYNKDALTLAADTGIFNGGRELAENFREWFTIPAEDFTPAGTIPADDLKAASISASADNTRPVLTVVHIAPDGYIEGCDGFRAYRKKGAALDPNALKTPFEQSNGLNISAAVAAFGFKGNIEISNGDKYIRLTDGTITIYARKIEGQYINMASIYEGRGAFKREYNKIIARIIDVKGFAAALKAAISAKDDRNHYRGGTIVLKARKGFIDYFIPALNIYGSAEADTDATPEGFNVTFNPRYLYDAIANQECNTLEIADNRAAPLFISGTAEKCALCLPIRDGGEYYFTEYDASQEAPEAPAEVPAEAVTPEAPANDPEKEAEAIARINERQNKENHFVNISREDVKQEIEKQEAEAPADDPETIPPEVQEARTIYKRLIACKFTPSKVQEAEADAIYTAYRDRLAPIARKAGGLYIDTLSIIAATMAVYDDLMEA
ncbi:MAG: hypothetical protein IKE94_01095 [Aeriscardovia sp.]|nr:hypothetical protein [Aeriscardovia sp.]